MSLVPAFEIGLLNAWIFMLLYFLIAYVPGYFISREKAKKAFSSPPYNKKEKNIYIVLEAIYFVSLVYTIFLPLKLGTTWFYAGLFIYLLGMIINALAVMSFANTPLNKPVTKGIYHISRNPFYFGYFLICIGIGVACISWIFLAYTVVYLILQHILIIPGERFCLERYGESYREYMERVPRWMGK